MRSNKKGFTLIELLAVIVILAIIALIATPIVLSTINKAKEGALKSSAYSVISAVENKIAGDLIDNPTGTIPKSVTDLTGVTVKGTQPSTISLDISNGVVTGGTITFSDGEVTVLNGEVTSIKLTKS